MQIERTDCDCSTGSNVAHEQIEEGDKIGGEEDAYELDAQDFDSTRVKFGLARDESYVMAINVDGYHIIITTPTVISKLY